MKRTLKLISSGTGLLVTLGLVAGFAFVTAPQTEASIPLPPSTTTAPPEIITPITTMQKVSKPNPKVGVPTTTSAPSTTSTTLSVIPPELVDRIDEGERWSPENDGMGEEAERTTTIVATLEESATDYIE